MRYSHVITLSVSLMLFACGKKIATYTYPTPVDTKSKAVRILESATFTTSSGVIASCDFPGGRLASFSESQDTFTAFIPAENQPINPSPWYAFSLRAPTNREVIIKLEFPIGTGNRYLPKTAKSLKGPWNYLSFDRVDTVDNHAYFSLQLGPQPLFLAGQEVIATDSIKRWISTLEDQANFSLSTIGTSTMGRPIWAIDLGEGPEDKRETFVFLSRQHPPEVTGFLAFQSFFERILANDELATSFRESYRILVVPVVNPDGVDEGHWRHNAGGIDLNRDWAKYRQPEVNSVVTWLQEQTHNRQVVWGMDFHSTQYDVLYTHDPSKVAFRNVDKLNAWSGGLANWASISYPGASENPSFTPLGRPLITGQDTLRIEPDAIGKPTSASWMAQHFAAVGVTYEVGDEQDRAYIHAKATKAAELLMQVWSK